MLPLVACVGPSANVPLECEDRSLDEDVVVTSQEELDVLPTVTGIRSLTIIDSDVTSLERLACLESVEWIHIENNAELVDLRGLDGLKTVSGEYDMANQGLDSRGLVISGNPSLVSLEGLGSLEEVWYVLRLESNPSLADLSGLAPDAFISHLAIMNNDGLESLAPFEVFTSVGGGTLRILDNDSLTDLRPLEFMNDASLYLEGNASLETLAPLTQFVGGFLVVKDNPVLADTTSLADLAALGVWFARNPELEHLSGMRMRVSSNIALEENESLVDVPQLLDADRPLDDLCPGGLVLGGGPPRTRIADNPALETLAGFAARTYLCGGAEIVNNDALADLDGLGSLRSLPTNSEGKFQSLLVADNAVLTSVSHLDPARDGSLQELDALEILDNPVLPTCDAEQLVAGLVAVGWTGVATIENNGDGACP